VAPKGVSIEAITGVPRTNKVKHIYLHYVVYLPFSQNFFAHNARSVAFYFPVRNAMRNVILPARYIFVYFGIIIPNGVLPKCTKTRVKSLKIAYAINVQKYFAAGDLPQTLLGELTSFLSKDMGSSVMGG